MTLEHLPDFEESLQCFKGMDTIVLGDLNVELDKSRSSRSQRVADLLTEIGIIDLVRHFQQHLRFWDVKTWTQVRKGAVLRSRCDYILGMDRCHFELVAIRYMRSYTPGHFDIQARLLIRPT